MILTDWPGLKREAKVLASLNHPNIGHIYGLEEAAGQKALVLELVEGPTLADRIALGRFTVDTSWAYQAITLPQGAFHTSLGNMRVTYNFTPSVFVQSLIQYNDRTERWSTNLRFHVLETAGTGLFVVYNDTESLEGLGPVNRAVIIKYVHQFDILR